LEPGIFRVCSVGAIKSVVGELEKDKLDFVGVQEVRWEGGNIKRQKIIYFSMKKGLLIAKHRQCFSYIIESFQRLKW
jgi:hypothetical protein